MRTALFLCALSLGVAVPTSAAPRWLPLTVAATGQSLDTLSTVRFLAGDRCVEGNPRFGAHPTTTRLVARTVAVVGAVAFFDWLTHRSSVPRRLRWLGTGVAYTAGGIGGLTAAWNVRHCGW